MKPTRVLELSRETFVHFTSMDSALQIVAEKRLRLSLAELAEAVFAVSATYGAFVPTVQHSFFRRYKIPQASQAAVVFTTSTRPEVGYVEEVVWRGDVLIEEALVVSALEAIELLGRDPLEPLEFALYDDPDWGHDGDGRSERLAERVPGEPL